MNVEGKAGTLHTGVVDVFQSMKGRYQRSCKSGLGCCVKVLALMSCGQLPRTIKIGVTKVTTHKKVRALEIVPIRVSFYMKGSSFFKCLTELDLGDPLSVIV